MIEFAKMVVFHTNGHSIWLAPWLEVTFWAIVGAFLWILFFIIKR